MFIPITWRILPALFGGWLRHNWFAILIAVAFLALLWLRL